MAYIGYYANAIHGNDLVSRCEWAFLLNYIIMQAIASTKPARLEPALVLLRLLIGLTRWLICYASQAYKSRACFCYPIESGIAKCFEIQRLGEGVLVLQLYLFYFFLSTRLYIYFIRLNVLFCLYRKEKEEWLFSKYLFWVWQKPGLSFFVSYKNAHLRPSKFQIEGLWRYFKVAIRSLPEGTVNLQWTYFVFYNGKLSVTMWNLKRRFLYFIWVSGLRGNNINVIVTFSSGGKIFFWV